MIESVDVVEILRKFPNRAMRFYYGHDCRGDGLNHQS